MNSPSDVNGIGVASRNTYPVAAYGASTLTVQTGAKNTPAFNLYAQAGFVELRRWLVGREPLELVKLSRLPQSGAQPAASIRLNPP